VSSGNRNNTKNDPQAFNSEGLSSLGGMDESAEAAIEAPRKRKKRSVRSPRHIAMDLLARRDHTRHELYSKLFSKLSSKLEAKIPADGLSAEYSQEFLADEINEVLDELEADGLLNESRFAESFVNSRIRRGLGPARIRRELGEKGVRGQAADLAFEAAEADWLEQARAVREKKFGNELPSEYKERARQARFLQYRGFTSEQIQRVLGGDD